MAGSRTRQNLNLIGGVLAAAIGGYCAFRVWVYVNRLRPDPQAIVIAMYPPPKDGRYYDDEEIFRAIREFGDVNGSAETSQPGNRITFLEMAIRLERRRQVKLLLDHGADPDREDESGGTPLFHAIKWGEEAPRPGPGCMRGRSGRGRVGRRARAWRTGRRSIGLRCLGDCGGCGRCRGREGYEESARARGTATISRRARSAHE